jgi:acetolactate synthase-1/2/3 large subunit
VLFLKVKEAIVNILKMEGVNFVTCFPPNKLINPCAEYGIRTILVRQERVAINIADGFARVSFKPSVALVAGGVGIENAFSGISQAYSDMVPILVFVDQSSLDRIGTRPIQDFDALFTLHKVTKWVERINSKRQTEEFLRRAFTYLRSGKTGPVVLEVPEDLAEENMDTVLSYKPVKGWKCAGDPEDVKAVVKALSNARNPLLYVGEGAFYAKAWDEVREFAELLKLPVMTTLKAKSIFPEDHPLSVGVGGRTGSKVATHFLKKADLVLAIGASLTRSLTTSIIGAPMPKGKIIVQSTVDEWDINKDYYADYVIVGDAKLVLRQLIEEVKRQNVRLPGREGLEDEIRRLKEEWLKEWMPKLTSNEVPINPYRVVWEIIQTVDRKNTIITHDAGCPRDHLAPFYEAIIPRGYLGWGHHSTLGYSLGGAMGAKLACPDKTVINFIGDAGFGMVGMDFETAVREKIPILTILVNNSGMGTYFEWTPSTSKLSGNYAKVAEALGGYSERIEKPDEISPALKRAIKETKNGKPALVEIITKVDVDFQTKYWKDL